MQSIKEMFNVAETVDEAAGTDVVSVPVADLNILLQVAAKDMNIVTKQVVARVRKLMDPASNLPSMSGAQSVAKPGSENDLPSLAGSQSLAGKSAFGKR